MNPFTDFTLEIPEDLKYAKEHSVRIELTSAYQWGRGWSTTEAKEFEEVVYPALTKSGAYKIHPSDDPWGGCPHLVSTDPTNRLDLYMHPMEFTGYANEEDLHKITEILSGCKPCIKKVCITKNEPVYDMPDYAYRKLLIDNAKAIVDCVAKKIKNPQTRENYLQGNESGFDFSRVCRIPRYKDKTGLTSSDVDIITVSEILTIAQKLGAFDKDRDMDKDDDMER